MHTEKMRSNSKLPEKSPTNIAKVSLRGLYDIFII